MTQASTEHIEIPSSEDLPVLFSLLCCIEFHFYLHNFEHFLDTYSEYFNQCIAFSNIKTFIYS